MLYDVAFMLKAKYGPGRPEVGEPGPILRKEALLTTVQVTAATEGNATLQATVKAHATLQAVDDLEEVEVLVRPFSRR